MVEPRPFSVPTEPNKGKEQPPGWYGLPGNLAGYRPMKDPPKDRSIKVRNDAHRLENPPPYFGSKEFIAKWDNKRKHWVRRKGTQWVYCHFHAWTERG